MNFAGYTTNLETKTGNSVKTRIVENVLELQKYDFSQCYLYSFEEFPGYPGQYKLRYSGKEVLRET